MSKTLVPDKEISFGVFLFPRLSSFFLVTLWLLDKHNNICTNVQLYMVENK